MNPASDSEADSQAVKYHADGKTVFAKGNTKNGKSDGYWQWYRKDGTLKRSGYFQEGEPVGEWTTYDQTGKVYKVTKGKA